MAVSGVRPHDPLTFQRTNRAMPKLYNPRNNFGLIRADSYAEENAIRHWNVSINSPKLGLGSIIDIRA